MERDTNGEGDDEDDEEDDKYENDRLDGDREAEEEINSFILGAGEKPEQKPNDQNYRNGDNADTSKAYRHRHHQQHHRRSHHYHAEGRVQRHGNDEDARVSNGEVRKVRQGSLIDRRERKDEERGREHIHSSSGKGARGKKGSTKNGDHEIDSYYHRRGGGRRREGKRERRKHDSSRHRSYDSGKSRSAKSDNTQSRPSLAQSYL